MAANIYGIARLLYTNAEDGKDYRKEIADVYMKQGEICLSNKDYENALIDHKKALESRQQICSPISREVADSDFFIGIASYCNAKAHALLSKTDASLKEEALKIAAESVTYLKNAKHIMEHYAVDKAIELGVLKTESEDDAFVWSVEVTDENRSELMEELKKKKDVPSEVEELLSIVEDIDVDVKAASEFSVEKVIDEEKNSVSLLRDLLQEQEEDEEDEDFSEDEEEDDDDVVIEDVEELKKSVKRIGESLPDNTKEAKHE